MALWAATPVLARARAAADDDPPGATVDAGLLDLAGPVDVVLRLSRPGLAETVTPNATRDGSLPDAATQHATVAAAEAQQRSVARAAAGVGATKIGTLSRSLNGVVVHVDASAIPELAGLPGVTQVLRVPAYEMSWPRDTAVPSGSLAQATRYLDVDRMRDEKFDGSHTRVAVIDSGIDFTHANLGGPGTPEMYTQCYGTPPAAGVPEDATQARNVAPTGACAGLFGAGAKKVVGGYDFVGETWPDGPVAPDPNPIDFEGHGTHVADILAGASADGTHLGLAPGAQIYALKACSARTTSCNGAAVLAAIDWALDPNGDGNMDDAVDVINMSFGSLYGQPEGAGTLAVANAVRAGVVVAVAAGNDGDKPWIVGQPSVAPGAISVAETALPDSSLLPVRVASPLIQGLPGNTVKYAVPQTWSPAPQQAISGVLTVPAGAVGATGTAPGMGCDASNFSNFDSAASPIAVIDRGTCDASLKASNAAAAGALAVVLVDDRDEVPPSLNLGQGDPTVPAVFVSLANGSLLKTAVAAGPVEVNVDPGARISLTNTMADTSSRGPSQIAASVKPDLGAPGAWTSAVAGTGSVERPFSGTSGATPVVAAAAAILRQAFPDEDPATIKERLIGTADTANRTADLDGNLRTTPITRIGGGEVRPFAALSADTQVGDPSNGAGNLSLGVQTASGRKYVLKRITIRNSSDHAQSYRLNLGFRDPAHAKANAITLFAPYSVQVPSGGEVSVPVVFIVNAERLPPWAYFDQDHDVGLAGAKGDDGRFLDGAEFDGYLTVRSGTDVVATLGWQALPKRAASVTPSSTQVTPDANGTAPLELRNMGVADGVVDAFSLTGSSPQRDAPAAGQPGSAGSNEAAIDLAAVGVRTVGDSLQFAITQYERRPTPQVPALLRVEIDTTGDGTPDRVVFNNDFNSFNPVDGRTYVFAGPDTSTATRLGPVDADTDSANQIFSVPLSPLGLKAGQTFSFRVLAFDRYFTGQLEDHIDGMSYTVGRPMFSIADGATFVVPAHATAATATVQSDPEGGPSSETGLLLLYRVNAGAESTAVTVTAP
jgi:minor extracellular serine protease Vpr